MEIKMMSLKELSTRTGETVSRFPLLTFFLCVGAADHLYMDIYNVEKFKHISRNISLSLLIFLPVLYSIRLLYESGWIGKHKRLMMSSISVIAAFVYFHFLPDQPLTSFYSSQFAVFFISSLCLCFVCVKQGAGDDNFFWSFNASLFIRLAITSLYILIIIIGTSVALGTIDALFKTKLVNTNEMSIVIVTLWIFAPLFFLSGVPSLSSPEETMEHKSRWVKNIGIYVMVPLTTVYLGILYTYGAKILLQWQLPEGKVSHMVLSFATFGIVSLLIIFPFQKDENSKWCYWFSRYFYFLQIPLLFLLFIAIFTRVFTYGITFMRYYVLALSIWLLFLTVFMVIKKNKNLIIIPFSLLIVLVLSIIGPWSSFNVSYMSQKGQLLKLLSTNNLILNDKITPAKQRLPSKVKEDISSIVRYLDDYGKLQNLAYLTSSGKTLTPETFTEKLGFKYVTSFSGQRDGFAYYSDKQPIVIPTNGYHSFARFREDLFFNNTETRRLQSGDLVIEFFPKTATFRFTDGKSCNSQIQLEEIVEHFKAAGTKNNADCCKYLYKDNSFEIQCLIDRLSGWTEEDGTHFNDVDVDFLIRRK